MTEPIPALRFRNVTYHFPFARLIRSHTAQERDELAATIRGHKRVLVRVVTYTRRLGYQNCCAPEPGRFAPAEHFTTADGSHVNWRPAGRNRRTESLLAPTPL
ncbi:hypothetical protein R5W23_001411 [Gemmata sp. JC673]|uniref:Uncharacterized protein n=1 Tax=Gemmata algarum TaxID=2975278 RepID=A0ABU5F2M6_9BACT|nr:hypothetical protein [Gemmata algarum]MDY3560186.1 hypothetical protein [Gemmata algarum]